MQTYRILYLRENRLERLDAVPGIDLLEAIDIATERSHGSTAEIWSDRGKVGIVAPPPDARPVSAGGAEITEEMRARLRLVR